MNWTCKQKQECSISIHSLEATKITPKYMLFAFNEAQKLFLKNLLAERMWILNDYHVKITKFLVGLLSLKLHTESERLDAHFCVCVRSVVRSRE